MVFFFLNGTLLPYYLHLFFLFSLRTRAVWQLIAASVKYIIRQEYVYRKKALMYSIIIFLGTKCCLKCEYKYFSIFHVHLTMMTWQTWVTSISLDRFLKDKN